jgi:hypothetical protein
MVNNIGVLNEKPLHAALKAFYSEPGDQHEVKVDGYVIDILRDGQLIEIQTGNFASIKRKIFDLSTRYPLRLVFPIAQEKWILKLQEDEDSAPKRRKSPMQGRVNHIFRELVSFPQMILEPNFSMEVVLIQEEEVRRYIGKRRWRKKGWGIEERRLLKVIKSHRIEGPGDILKLIPRNLPVEFTTQDLACEMGEPLWLAQKTAYCLRQMGIIEQIGKLGRQNLYMKAADFSF